jgi:hypothetical protein
MLPVLVMHHLDALSGGCLNPLLGVVFAVNHGKVEKNKQDISHVEKVLSESDDLVKDNMDITRVDKEIQA